MAHDEHLGGSYGTPVILGIAPAAHDSKRGQKTPRVSLFLFAGCRLVQDAVVPEALPHQQLPFPRPTFSSLWDGRDDVTASRFSGYGIESLGLGLPSLGNLNLPVLLASIVWSWAKPRLPRNDLRENTVRRDGRLTVLLHHWAQQKAQPAHAMFALLLTLPQYLVNH
jgi:hypothetical protein